MNTMSFTGPDLFTQGKIDGRSAAFFVWKGRKEDADAYDRSRTDERFLTDDYAKGFAYGCDAELRAIKAAADQAD